MIVKMYAQFFEILDTRKQGMRRLLQLIVAQISVKYKHMTWIKSGAAKMHNFI